jgi:transketolase
MVARCLEASKLLAGKQISAAVINMSSIKPADKELITRMARKTGAIVTAEDHNIVGGLGSCVAEIVCAKYPVPIEMVGIQDRFGESGEPMALAIKYKLMPQDIADAAKRVLKRKLL